MFLNIDKAAFGYRKPLINNADTALQTGEICLIIGNNGVGKTTLLKTLLKQIPTLSGDIFLNNQNLKALSHEQIAEQIAVVFSKSEIPAHFKLRDLISLGKYIHYPYYFDLNNDDKIEVSKIIDDLGLQQYADFPLRNLSDGNLQKAFIGRALAQNSPMIILDEPTTHLDEKNKITILKILRNLAKKHHKLILFSSHDWRLAKEFADKIWLLHDGKLDTGIAEEILLKHHELLNPQLFNLGKGFVAAKIDAPALQKEMLYSLLQKNYAFDISATKFSYNGDVWTVKTENEVFECKSFEEIVKILNNIY